MPTASQSLVEKRAGAMAVVLLTQRRDLRLSNAHDGRGVDFVVEILNRGKLSGRLFAVQVKGLTKHAQLQNLRLSHALARVRDLPFPVCIFAFNVANDDAYYCWLKEPALGVPSRRLRNGKEVS